MSNMDSDEDIDVDIDVEGLSDDESIVAVDDSIIANMDDDR